MKPFQELGARSPDSARTSDPQVEAAELLRSAAFEDIPRFAVRLQGRVEHTAKAELEHPARHKKTADGADVTVDSGGKVQRIERSNGTVIDCIYSGNTLTQINETRGGKTTEWKKDAGEDRWRSMDYIGAQRIKFQVNDLGQTSFEDVGGTRYVTHGDGAQTRRKADGATVEIDKDWHITSVLRANGSKLLCKYNGKVMTEVSEVSQGSKSTEKWTYDEKAGTWSSGSSPEIRKNLSVSDLGNYAYISANKNDVVHIEYADGNKRDFTWSNGKVQSFTERTAGGATTWTRDGATENFLSKTTREERKNVAVSLNGDLSYIDESGYKHIHKFDVTEEVLFPQEIARSKAVQEAHDALLGAAGKSLSADDFKQFSFDLNKFEERAHSNSLKGDQVVASIKELQKILEPEVQKPFVVSERAKLAEETLQHIAYPRGIDQGYHDTCGASTAEVYVACLYPEKLAALVREVADTGQFKTTTGLIVKPNDGSLRQDWEAKNRTPYDSGAWGRSYASQIFQVIGINAAYQAAGSAVRYEQGRPQNPKDTGERTVNNSDGKVNPFGGMYDAEVIQVTRQTCGHDVTVLRRGTNMNTVDDLRKSIADLQKQHQLPAVLWVSTKNEPFWTATGRGRGGGVPGGHYVTVWDMDTSDKVLIDNQWGRAGDYESLRRLTLRQAFDAGAP